MRKALGQELLVNSVQDYRLSVSTCPGRNRTIRIKVRPQGTGHEIHAWGSALPEMQLPPHIGHLEADETRIRGWTKDLLSVWHRNVVMWQDVDDESDAEALYRRPVAEHVDLRAAISPEQRDAIWRDVAVAGRKLFTLLFNEGDDALRNVGKLLTRALWDDDQVITIHAESLIIPWSMLYVPPPNAPDEMDSELTVDRRAFLGYRHLIENAFHIGSRNEADVRYTTFKATAFFDDELDSRQPSIVAPALATLERRASVCRVKTKPDAERRLRGDGLDDHLIYFCCHCVELSGSATLQLTDDTISSGDIAHWIGHGGGLRSNPLVLVNACQAGELGAHPPSHFSSELLKKGAGSLLGPSVSIPAMFAGTFAEEFFSRVLTDKVSFGETVRDLARYYTDMLDNPLGLSYTMFHGLDGHFCQVEESHAPASAKGR